MVVGTTIPVAVAGNYSAFNGLVALTSHGGAARFFDWSGIYEKCLFGC